MGLYYYRARYYDPVLAKFISSDAVLSASDDHSHSTRTAMPETIRRHFVDPLWPTRRTQRRGELLTERTGKTEAMVRALGMSGSRIV